MKIVRAQSDTIVDAKPDTLLLSRFLTVSLIVSFLKEVSQCCFSSLLSREFKQGLVHSFEHSRRLVHCVENRQNEGFLYLVSRDQSTILLLLAWDLSSLAGLLRHLKVISQAWNTNL